MRSLYLSLSVSEVVVVALRCCGWLFNGSEGEQERALSCIVGRSASEGFRFNVVGCVDINEK